MVDLSKCNAGSHPYEAIYRVSKPYDEETVVRWCPLCGCIVIDVDYDNRTSPGAVMKIKCPQIYKDFLKNPTK